MSEMFGLSMTTIMYVLLGMFGTVVALIAVIFVRNRIIFMLGLRNIPRRVAQTVLIILGLMLSTVIIAAAFTTGDTVDYSITKQTYDLAGNTDIILDGEVSGASDPGGNDQGIHGGVGGQGGAASDLNIGGADYRGFLDAADQAGLKYVDGYAGLLVEPVPAINLDTRLSEPDVSLVGVDDTRLEAFPDIKDANSGDVLSMSGLQSGEVFLNESAADELDASAGSRITIYIQNQPVTFTVKAIVEDTLMGGAINSGNSEGIVIPLSEMQALFNEDEVTVIAVSATGGVRDSLQYNDEAEAEINNLIAGNDLRVEVSDTKAQLIDDAEEFGNIFTTFFLALGLFSIGAGVLLIVMIFVMLAAERKSEMGMARAVGTKRIHLIEMFLAEGTAYNFFAAIIGVVAGILVAFALAVAASALFSSFGISFTPHVTLRTAIISFCIGSVLTFITVAFSSWRISNLNIVAAIRDTEENRPVNPEQGTFRGYARSLMNSVSAVIFPIGLMALALRGSNFAGSSAERYNENNAPWFPFPAGFLGFPFYQVAMMITGRQRVPGWPFFFPLVCGLYLVPILIYRFVRDRRPKNLHMTLMLAGIILPPLGVILVPLQHKSQRVIWGPGIWTVLALFGAYLVTIGMSSDTAFPFALGWTLAIGGLAVVLTYFGLQPRATYTTMGLVLLVFWGLLAGNRLEGIFGTLEGDIEMFFLSGVAMVTASTFVLIYNADIFLAIITRFGGRFGSVLPALRTAVAYPMANRFRTGMTLAMISLVVFALTTMSAMNLNYDRLFLADESRGGWDVQVVENPNNPLPSVKQALEGVGSPVAGEIKDEGAVLYAGFGSSTEVSRDDENWDDYAVNGLSDSFIDNGSVPLDRFAAGYDTPEAVWQALKTDPNVAVVDSFPLEGGFDAGEFTLTDFPDDSGYDPPSIFVRDATTGESREVKVIGVVSFGASNNFMGIYMGETGWRETFGDPELSVHFVSLTNPGDSGDVAREIESALMTTGSQAESLKKIAEENNALSRNFLYLMQAFMGLGLVVGIAAIGVIAFRTVVERRQQIGMLRAIGYKKSTVSLSFLLESGFVTVLGVFSGVILGLWLAYFLVTSDDFPGDGGTFYIPWLQIAVITGLTLVASFFMTLIPSRQAAGVPTAEALRYE